MELTDAVLHEAPVAPRSVSGTVSPGLEAVILKCLDKDPELRYQTAKELLVDLERLQVSASSTSGARPEPTLAEVGRRRRRRRAALTAAAAAVILAVAASLWLLRSPRPPRITNARPLTGGMEGLNAGGGWATDGTRVYYLAEKASRTTVYQVPVTGGEPAPVPIALPVPYNPVHLWLPSPGVGVAHDGLRAGRRGRHARKGSALWTVPVPAGAPSRLGNLEAYLAALSPDGTMLALSQRGYRLLVVRRDGTVDPRMAAAPVAAGRPRMVAGRQTPALPGRLVPTSGGRGSGRCRSTAGEPRALWPGEAGRWTPDGRYYVFDRRDEAEARNDIYAVREPGLALALAVAAGAPHVRSAELQRRRAEPRREASLRLGRPRIAASCCATTRRLGRFEKYLGGASVYYVDASRDGQWLTWVSFPDGALWRGRSDGSDRLKLTGPGWQVSSAAMVARRDRASCSRAGAPEERLLSIFNVSREAESRSFSRAARARCESLGPLLASRRPDHSLLAHLAQTPGDLGIYRLDVRTRAVSVLPGTERLQYPKCSPRGDILAMEKPAQGQTAPTYWAFFVDRGRWERLGPLTIGYPNWSRDGESFTGLNRATRRIERWSRATGRLEPVADVSDIPLLTWVAGPWMGLAPDGSPLVVRDRSTRDLYALDWEAP